MPSYSLTGAPVTIDDGASTQAAVTNTGSTTVLVEPLGRQIAPGASLTVPCWSQVPTTLRTAGAAGSADVTLTAGSPAARQGPGGVTFDPGGAASMSVSVSGGSWFTNEGLTTAATFPRTVTTPTQLYPAAKASVAVTMTVGTASKTVGLNVTDGVGESVRWEPTTDAERTQTILSAGSATYARRGVTNGIRLKRLPRDMAAAAAHQRGDVGSTATRVPVVSFGDSVGGLNMVHLYPLLLRALGGRAGALLSGQNAATTIGTPTGLTSGTDTTLWPVTVYTLAAGGSAECGIGGAVTTCDTIKVYYFKNGGGTFKVQVDGVDEPGYTAVSTVGSGELGIITLSKTRGAHSVTLAHVSGGSVKLLLPGFVDSTVSGIVPIELALGGMELSTWIDSAVVRGNLSAFLADANPSMLTFEMKENSTANLATQIDTLLDLIQAATPTTDILLMSSTPSQNTSSDAVVTALRDLLDAEAEARGLPFYDQYRVFGSWDGINALGWGGDGVHRSTTCSEFLAGLLMSIYGLFTHTGVQSPFNVFAETLRATSAIDVQAAGATRVARLAPAGSNNDLAVTGNRWIKFMRADGTTEEARLVVDGATVGWLPRAIRAGSGNAGLYGTSATALTVTQDGSPTNYADLNARSLTAATAGFGLKIREGSNARMGRATLVGGTVTVANTSVTADSRIFLTTTTPGGTVGTPYVSARVNGTSFTITSTSAADTSTVDYLLVEKI